MIILMKYKNRIDNLKKLEESLFFSLQKFSLKKRKKKFLNNFFLKTPHFLIKKKKALIICNFLKKNHLT